jgi:uncharacterized membrane protein YgcG
MMNSQMNWTVALGQAYTNQQQGLISAIQQLRQQAQQAGNLVSNGQQSVASNGQVVTILPTTADAVYVPTYNVATIYTQPTVVTYGTPLAMGAWLTSDVDWNAGAVVYHGWTGGWGQYYYNTRLGGTGTAVAWTGSGPNAQHWGYGAAGTTATGTNYAARAGTTQWASGATTGSFSAARSNGTFSTVDRGWGGQYNGYNAGAASKTVVTPDGVYNVRAGGVGDGSEGVGGVQVRGYNQNTGYQSNSWTGSYGNNSMFANRSSINDTAAYSDRGYASRGSTYSGGYGGGYSGGGLGGGGFRSGGFGGGGFRR